MEEIIKETRNCNNAKKNISITRKVTSTLNISVTFVVFLQRWKLHFKFGVVSQSDFIFFFS